VKLCEHDPTVVGITAAMATGHWPDLLEKALAKRPYFDAGHRRAACRDDAAGMATAASSGGGDLQHLPANGPVDQLIHDGI